MWSLVVSFVEETYAAWVFWPLSFSVRLDRRPIFLICRDHFGHFLSSSDFDSIHTSPILVSVRFWFLLLSDLFSSFKCLYLGTIIPLLYSPVKVWYRIAFFGPIFRRWPFYSDTWEYIFRSNVTICEVDDCVFKQFIHCLVEFWAQSPARFSGGTKVFYVSFFSDTTITVLLFLSQQSF